MRYKLCTFGCDWPVIKGTLFGESCTFSYVFRLYWRDFPENSYLVLSMRTKFTCVRSVSEGILFSLLHSACCWVTQLLYQLLHIYQIYKIYIKTLETLPHVSVLGPSSGSHIVHAKVTLEIVTLISLYQLVLWQHAGTIPNWCSEINVILYSVTLARTIWLPDDGPRTETCRSVFNVLMCTFYKFYIFAVVGVIIEWVREFTWRAVFHFGCISF